MASHRFSLVALAVSATVWACGGGETSDGMDQDSTARDLTLAPVESTQTVAPIEDRPADPPVADPQPPSRPRPRPRTPPPPPPEDPPERDPDPPPPPPAPPTVAEGTGMTIYASDTLTSRHNNVGDAVTAVIADPVVDADGKEVIPAGAVFLGTISDVAPAGSPGGEGRMVLTFNRVEFGGASYAVQARTGSIGTRMKGRGVTAGDAAKVGAGAVVGAIAGRIIGGNKKGTAVGAVAGAAAGVGIAAATRDVDIILDAGAPIELALTAPFVLEPLR